MSRLDNGDFTVAADKGNKRRSCRATSFFIASRALTKICRLRAAQITSRRAQGPDVGGEGPELQSRDSEYACLWCTTAVCPHPQAIPHLSVRKMLVVNADFLARFTERSWNDLSAQRAVHEEDQLLRRRWQARIGPLLRRSFARSHSPAPIRQWTHPLCTAPQQCWSRSPFPLSLDDRRKSKDR